MAAVSSEEILGLDDAVQHSADPHRAATAVARILDAHPDGARQRLAAAPGLVGPLVTVVAASPDLATLCVADAGALDVLADLDHRQPPPCPPPTEVPNNRMGPDGRSGALLRWKQLELLRIAARDLCGLDSLLVVGEALANLADDLLAGAAGIALQSGLAVIGMGKLGARELNYASDIDLLLVGDANPHHLLDIARRAWRVDLDLRPEGRAGRLVRSLPSYSAYWQRWAQTWEFQALLKSRPVAGDEDLGQRFVEAAADEVWSRSYGADELRAIRTMKAQSEARTFGRGGGDRELKLGHGGIRDVEFAIQLLQLVHGRADPTLRVARTLDALAALAAGGYIAQEDANTLAEAYRFLRTVEHRLQLRLGQPTHSLPDRPSEQVHLARILGYRDSPGTTAGAAFDADLRRHRMAVRSVHSRLYFRPLLEAFNKSAARSGLSPEAASERLSAFGFSDALRTRRAVEALTAGLSRSSRLMQQLLPLLLEWLSASPDPDLGLLGLRTLTEGGHRRDQLMAACRESPESARRLCLLLGTSPIFGRGLRRQPDLLRSFADGSALVDRDSETLLVRARQAVAWRGDRDRQAGLLRFQKAEILRIASRDVLELATADETARSLTGLAESVLNAAIDLVAPTIPFAVIAMGHLGGGELAYGSDLDVVCVYDSDGYGASPAAAAEAGLSTAGALLRVVGGETPSRRIWTLDTTLRPEGRQGVLARSLESYAAYYDRWAELWERQALLRARPIAGDADLGRRFVELAGRVVWQAPLSDDDVRQIRGTKARIETLRIPVGEDPQFHLKLGRGSLSDIEWTVQLCQWRHQIPATNTLEALDALVEGGAIDATDANVLIEAYRFCTRTRDRLHLLAGGPGDSLPTAGPTLTTLARSLATTPSELRNEYRRLTRRARQVVEQIFYGRT